jgi:hypothetical protein
VSPSAATSDFASLRKATTSAVSSPSPTTPARSLCNPWWLGRMANPQTVPTHGEDPAHIRSDPPEGAVIDR